MFERTGTTQVIEARFSAEVWSVSSAMWAKWDFLRLPRLAGVTNARYLLADGIVGISSINGSS